MDFRERHRNAKPLPGFAQQGARAGNSFFQNSSSLNIHISVFLISSNRAAGIEIYPMIQKTLAAQVVVEAQDVGRRPVFLKPFQFSGGHAYLR